MSKVKLSSDLYESKSIYIRTNKQAKLIQVFIKKVITKHHYNCRFAIWFFGIDISINPFIKHIYIQVGKRFSSYIFVQCYIKKSISKTT